MMYRGKVLKIAPNLSNEEREKNRDDLRKLWIVTYNIPVKKRRRRK